MAKGKLETEHNFKIKPNSHPKDFRKNLFITKIIGPFGRLFNQFPLHLNTSRSKPQVSDYYKL